MTRTDLSDMRPGVRPRIADRIVWALSLQPMTVRELARCLCVNESRARETIYRMREAGQVGRVGERKGRTVPAALWALPWMELSTDLSTAYALRSVSGWTKKKTPLPEKARGVGRSVTAERRKDAGTS